MRRIGCPLRRIGLAVVLTVSLILAPLAGEAQQARLYRVGVVFQGGGYSAGVDGLRDALRELGFAEGRQLVLHVRDAKGDLQSVEVAAQSFENEKVDLI
jgi:ABC-type uncharacterized transport system substrate-binding protein